MAARPAEGIVCKISHAGGRPILFLDRARYPETPVGWTHIVIDGERYRANFVKVAVNVARRPGGSTNEILRKLFGEHAGQPGTRHLVVFEPESDGYRLRPLDDSADEEP
jgi:hypothetical protein